jgi:hypothetical protein
VEKILLAVQHPAFQLALLELPMICVLNTKSLHSVMADPFRRFLWRTLPIALAIAFLVSLIHSLSYAMGAAVLSPYIQWAGLYGLYQRFTRVHGRPPRISEEIIAHGGSVSDHVFRSVASGLTVALPLAVVLLLAKILSGGGANFIG